METSRYRVAGRFYLMLQHVILSARLPAGQGVEGDVRLST